MSKKCGDCEKYMPFECKTMGCRTMDNNIVECTSICSYSDIRPSYDIDNLNPRPNPYAKELKSKYALG